MNPDVFQRTKILCISFFEKKKKLEISQKTVDFSKICYII
uniref:Uncharacterized protein n=1 Tax=Siphoviridae sp. ctoNj20 TaxID=2826085 RepID=A0A8D9PDZ9_9CAUD|nr:MAG TPA: hypothetical protein [Siphoviridae sp. ctoNj20]